ncbi:MAG: HAMP domain-containing sensor histidine kinase [Candidatus Eisenbacteria bacterium]
MKPRLARRILALTLLPILLAIGVSVILVDRQVRDLTEAEIQEHLGVARTLALDLLMSREQDLLTQGWIVARDPKFFAMLASPGIVRDASYRRTLEDIAIQFAATLDSDRLEILDDSGVVQAQFEPRHSALGVPVVPRNASTETDVASALEGTPVAGLQQLDGGTLIQSATVPVWVGDRIVGVLRHGRRIDTELLGKIRSLTRCEVAFRCGSTVTASTLLDPKVSHIEVTEPLATLQGDSVSVSIYRSIEPEERFLASLRTKLALIGLGVIATSLLGARAVVRRLTGPVQMLVRAAIHLERDEPDSEIDIQTGDELEYLGRRFGEMRSALRNQIQSLRELDRMKSTFLTIASHELRTPATIIQGNVELLEYLPLPDDDQYSEVIDGLRRGVTRLHGVLERIGDMALLDSEKMRLSMRPFDGRDLLPELSTWWTRTKQDRALAFEVSTPSDPAPLHADAGRLRQAVQNLLHNTLRFTPDGGSVRLSLELAGQTTRFVVEDNGIGVPSEHRDSIFEAFYEARDVLGHRSGDTEFGSAGLGLGLALSRSIAHAHGGTIAYEPVRTGGSRFIIEIPMAGQIESSQESGGIAA